jgi:hypothetical protein
LPLKLLAALCFVARLCFTVETGSAEEFAVSFKISPAGPQLAPNVPATLTLSLKTPGQLSAEWVMVRLDAPARGRFFSTDFPLVEGSTLLEARLPMIDGKAEWRQVFPIRGEYRLSAHFAGAVGAHTERTFAFRVYESRQKWLALGVFASGLFLIGMIAGRIFSAPGRAKGLKVGIWLVLCLTYCETTVDAAGAQANPKQSYAAQLAVSAPTVGRPARVQWSLGTAGAAEKPSANLSLSITHVEKNALVFAVEKIPVAGEFSLEYQFTDGSDYRVSAIAVTQDGGTVRQDQLVSVSAVAPPWAAQLPALVLFLLVIFLGLLAGCWSRRDRRSAERN